MEPHKNELHEALGKLETILETPVVPGELEAWIQQVQDACTEVGVRLRHQIEENHPQQFNVIQEQDTEMLQRVEQMKAEDDQLLELFQRLNHTTGRLLETAEQFEPSERNADHVISSVVKQGLDFVLAVRKQENAIGTWLVEAFNRDRGVAD